MKNAIFPSCSSESDIITSPAFIVPVVVGGILLITVLIAIGLLYYSGQRRPAGQIRECLQMYPGQFVRAALQYVMLRSHDEDHDVFDFDVIVFAQEDDCSVVHNYFIAALQGRRKIITRDDFLAGVPLVDAMDECICVCRWIVPVITSNFLSDHVCADFISRARLSRPHALIPIPVVWEQSLAVTDVSVAGLLPLGDPLYWPGDPTAAEDKRIFWSSLLERTRPTSLP